MSIPIPMPDSQTGLRALKAMLRERHPLAAMQVFHDELGDVFQIQLPGFKPVVMVGPEAARFVLLEARDDLRWRNEADPVTHLLRRGVLVVDGEEHDRLRHAMTPVLQRRRLDGYVDAMWRRTDQITSAWTNGAVVDMLVEMRKMTLLILLDVLYRVDFTPELGRLWHAILGLIRYISPGVWMIWPGVPRRGYRHALRQMDEYLYRIIRERRTRMNVGNNLRQHSAEEEAHDLIALLIKAGLDDDLIRDQLLTMLIAGHDTGTALLSWTLYLLGSHPEVLHGVRDEVDAVLGSEPPGPEQLGRLEYLGRVVKESLRLYPPIHLGSRLAATDLEYQGYHIPAGKRVIYSIYLTQRHKDFWPDPHRFDPDRHTPGVRQTPYAWLGFGGGPRNCIGGGLGLMESKVVLARLLQGFDLTLVERHVHLHMGATLEPRPGVRMEVRRRPTRAAPVHP
jgi:cytochrome P450